MPWYKNKKAIVSAFMLTMSFMLEGLVYFKFFQLSNLEVLDNYTILAAYAGSASVLGLVNAATLISLGTIAKQIKGFLSEKLIKAIGFISFSSIFLFTPTFAGIYIWSSVTKYLANLLEIEAYMANSTVLVLWVIHTVVFYATIYFTYRLVLQKESNDTDVL